MRRHAVVITLPLLALVAGCGSVSSAGAGNVAHARTVVSSDVGDDVTITSCGPGTTAQLAITNHASREADYSLEVEFLDRLENPLAAGTAKVTGLAVGQSRALRINGAPAASGSFTCRVGKLTRAS